jgi:hypothetical protein
MTRRHDDLHLALWSRDGERVRELLTAADWRHTRQEGYSVYELDDVRLEVAFLDHGEWPPNSFEHDVAEVAGVRARFVSLSSLGPPKGKAATIELTPAARAALLEARRVLAPLAGTPKGSTGVVSRRSSSRPSGAP